MNYRGNFQSILAKVRFQLENGFSDVVVAEVFARDDVVKEWGSLSDRISSLENKTQTLHNQIQTLKIKNDVQNLETETQTLKTDVQAIKNHVQAIKNHVQTLQNENQTLPSSIRTVRQTVIALNGQLGIGSLPDTLTGGDQLAEDSQPATTAPAVDVVPVNEPPEQHAGGFPRSTRSVKRKKQPSEKQPSKKQASDGH